MPYDINIIPINEAKVRIESNKGILRELSEKFSFLVPNARFMPKYKMGIWDGMIRLLDYRNQTIGKGLVPDIIKYCQSIGYSIKLQPKMVSPFKENIPYNIEPYPLPDFIKEVYDYQEKAIKVCLKKKRTIILSSTSSGKSLIISLLYRILLDNNPNLKILLIVPRVSLVEQFYKDMQDYFEKDDNFSVEDNVHKIYSGQDKNTDKSIIISTWQSLYRLPPNYFHQFDIVMGDEVHEYEAAACSKIMDNSINAFYRFGFTGTLKDSKVSELSLKAMFGPVIRVSSTKDLMNKGIVAPIKIKPIILTYPPNLCKLMKKAKYKDENDYINSLTYRNYFICKLADSLNNNTLVLYKHVEKHGKVLYEMYKEKFNKKEAFLITSNTAIDERERIKELCKSRNDLIIFSSYALFSTGISINNLHNIIFGSSIKSKIKVLQSIGRSIRLHDSKDFAYLYDIADDFSDGKKTYENYSLKHFYKRLELYLREGFEVKSKRIKVNA